MGREITLKKGTDCFIAVWNLHRSPDLWENPEKFDPMRFKREFSNPGVEAGPGRYCSPRHPTHSGPSFLELNGIL